MILLKKRLKLEWMSLLMNIINLIWIFLLLVALAQNVANKQTYKSLISQLCWRKESYIEIDLPTTKKQLWKVINRDKSNLDYSVYCTLCKQKIGYGKVPTQTCLCGKCGPNKDEKRLGTFILVPLKPQLRDLLNVPNIVKSLRYKHERLKINQENIEDIHDGAKYR